MGISLGIVLCNIFIHGLIMDDGLLTSFVDGITSELVAM